MVAGENVDGLHVWDKRRRLPQDSRARQVGWADEVEVQSAHVALVSHVSCFTWDDPWPLADFFNILLDCWPTTMM